VLQRLTSMQTHNIFFHQRATASVAAATTMAFGSSLNPWKSL